MRVGNGFNQLEFAAKVQTSSWLRRIAQFPALFLVLLPVLVLSTTAARPSQAELTLEEITVAGMERSYYLHLPSNFSPQVSLPIVLILHGGGKADGDEMAARTDYAELSDREQFIAVYPNGINAQWNDGRGKTYRRSKNIPAADDVGFISALIDFLISRYNGDSMRVYVTGVSNGGMMTFRLACEISGKLTAIALVIASMPANIIDTCHPESPLSVLMMNGTDDPLVPWEGGSVKFFKRTMGTVVSTDASVKFWVTHNRCISPPQKSTFPDRDVNDKTRVEVSRYEKCSNRTRVVLYSVIGGGHTFPGSKAPHWPMLMGNKNNDINGADEIWGFFSVQKSEKN